MQMATTETSPGRICTVEDLNIAHLTIVFIANLSHECILILDTLEGWYSVHWFHIKSYLATSSCHPHHCMVRMVKLSKSTLLTYAYIL